MSASCRRCKKETPQFFAINYTTLEGWCGRECMAADASDERERRKKEEAERKRIRGY